MKKYLNYLNGILVSQLLERLCFFGINSILLLIISKNVVFYRLFLYSGLIVGTYKVSCYLFSFLVPILNKYTSIKTIILISSIGISLGYFLILFYKNSLLLFFIGLFIIGFFTSTLQPSIRTIVGKESEFSLVEKYYSYLYISVNIGSFIGPFIFGLLKYKYNYSWLIVLKFNFLLSLFSSFFVIISTVIFDKLWVSRSLENKPISNNVPIEEIELVEIKNTEKVNYNLDEVKTKKISASTSKLKIMIILTIFVFFFDICYEQNSILLTKYTEDYVSRYFFKFEFPTSWFQIINPFIIVLFSSLMLKINRSEISKISTGIFLSSFSMFILIIPSIIGIITKQKSNLGYIVTSYFLISIGELLVRPVLWTLCSKKLNEEDSLKVLSFYNILLSVASLTASLFCYGFDLLISYNFYPFKIFLIIFSILFTLSLSSGIYMLFYKNKLQEKLVL